MLGKMLLAVALVLAMPAHAQDSSTSPGCIGTLRIEALVDEALQGNVRDSARSFGGIVNNRHHAAFRVDEEWKSLENPQYPVLTALEFRFQSAFSNVESFRSALCADFEEALTTECGTVRRNDLYLSCSFVTTDQARTGTLVILPDTLTESDDLLIVVASEW